MQKLFDHKKCDNISERGQKEESKGITEFYRKLYSYEEVETKENDSYANCRNLSQNAKEFMEKEPTEEDILTALGSCSDSA